MTNIIKFTLLTRNNQNYELFALRNIFGCTLLPGTTVKLNTDIINKFENYIQLTQNNYRTEQFYLNILIENK